MNQNINSPQGNCGQIKIFNELYAHTTQSETLKLLPYRKQPVSREVIRFGERNHHVGLFASRVNQSMIPYESSLERDACVCFESKQEIMAYSSQPTAIELNINGKCTTVYPDFLLETKKQNLLIDIKFSKNAETSKFKARTEALLAYCSNRNIGYSVMTENDIRTAQLDQSRWLTSVARGIPHDALIETVWFWLDQIPKETLYSEVWAMLTNYSSVKTVIAGFILDGHLIVDLEKSINDQKIVRNDFISEGESYV